jgi:hypothetical protein
LLGHCNLMKLDLGRLDSRLRYYISRLNTLYLERLCLLQRCAVNTHMQVRNEPYSVHSLCCHLSHTKFLINTQPPTETKLPRTRPPKSIFRHWRGRFVLLTRTVTRFRSSIKRPTLTSIAVWLLSNFRLCDYQDAAKHPKQQTSIKHQLRMDEKAFPLW